MRDLIGAHVRVKDFAAAHVRRCHVKNEGTMTRNVQGIKGANRISVKEEHQQHCAACVVALSVTGVPFE